jgi:hypothetical protein
MPARKRRLVVTPEARADINGIRLYTQQRWESSSVVATESNSSRR